MRPLVWDRLRGWVYAICLCAMVLTGQGEQLVSASIDAALAAWNNAPVVTIPSSSAASSDTAARFHLAEPRSSTG